MRSSLRLIGILTLVSLTGCLKSKPALPTSIKDKLLPNRVATLETLAKDYDAAIARSDLAKAKLDRNELVFEMLGLIDDAYNQFESDLFLGRDKGNFAADFTELSGGAVTGITSGERVKSILAIALPGFKGARKSFDVNFFREKTTEVVALKMRASRAKVLQTIHQGMGLQADEYSLAAALDDVINYYQAGSINNAFLELAQDTGADAKVSREAAADFKISPFITPDVQKELRVIRQATEKLREKIFSSDKSTRDSGQAAIVAVLKQLYNASDVDGKTPDQLFTMLNDKIRDARNNSDDGLRKKILAALQSEVH